MRHHILILALLLAAFTPQQPQALASPDAPSAASSAPAAAPDVAAPAIPPSLAQGTVVHAVDGDTLDVDLAGTVECVRLIGIDTPTA